MANDTVQRQLDALRDIHLPADPAWWPPAPGWWLSSILLVATIALLPRIVRKMKRYRVRRRTLKQVRSLERRAQTGDDQTVLADLSCLLREVAITRFPERHCASLTGNAWLSFLNATSEGIDFLSEPGSRLLDAPYRLRHDANVAELIALTRRWFYQNA